jgi:hypothetical protein
VGDAALGGFGPVSCRDWAVCSREFLSEPFFKINRVSPREPSDEHEGHVHSKRPVRFVCPSADLTLWKLFSPSHEFDAGLFWTLGLASTGRTSLAETFFRVSLAAP